MIFRDGSQPPRTFAPMAVSTSRIRRECLRVGQVGEVEGVFLGRMILACEQAKPTVHVKSHFFVKAGKIQTYPMALHKRHAKLKVQRVV